MMFLHSNKTATNTVSMYVCVFICMYVYMWCVYVHMCVCVSVCMWYAMHVHMPLEAKRHHWNPIARLHEVVGAGN